MPQRRQILYLVHRFPYPPNKGDRIRAFNLAKFLAREHDVSIATLADEPVDPAHFEALSKICSRLEVRRVAGTTQRLRGIVSAGIGRSISEGMFASKALRRVVDRWCREIQFDAVVLSASSIASYLNVEGVGNSQLVVDLVDVDSEKWREYAARSSFPSSWIYGLEADRLRRLELSLLERTDAVTLVSSAEADLFRSICEHDQVAAPHTTKIHAIPNGVDLDYFAPQDAPMRQDCAFVGAMDYRPNIDAVVWFCQNIWPGVRSRIPESTFRIVGRNPATNVIDLAKLPGVEVIGSVPDVRPWVAKSRIVVAPLRIARGIQNKVLEAMAMGKAVVASPEALAGLDVTPDANVVVARDAKQWTEQLVRLLQDDDATRNFALAARTFAEQHHDWPVTMEPLNRLLADREPRHAGNGVLEPIS